MDYILYSLSIIVNKNCRIRLYAKYIFRLKYKYINKKWIICMADTVDIKKILGARIQYIRKSLKMTQEQLAERIGIEPQYVSRIEIGKNYPAPDNLTKIAAALGVEVYELFVFGEEKSVPAMKKFVISELNRSNKTVKLVFNFCKAISQS